MSDERRQLKHEVYMRMTQQLARLSTCRRLSVGAVLLRRDGSVAGVGYNGALPGQPHCAPEICNASARCFNTRHAERSALDYSTGEVAAAYVTHDDARKDEICPAWGITHRQMLLNLGVPATLLGGDYDHWVKRWRIEIQRWALGQEFLGRDVVIAVPDVRRLNEAATIHDAGGVNVLVQRPGVKWNGHVTEMLAGVSQEHGQRSYEELSVFSDLKQGIWHPVDPVRGDSGRAVFDAGICNDGDVAALRPHAERVFDLLTKEK